MPRKTQKAKLILSKEERTVENAVPVTKSPDQRSPTSQYFIEIFRRHADHRD